MVVFGVLFRDARRGEAFLRRRNALAASSDNPLLSVRVRSLRTRRGLVGVFDYSVHLPDLSLYGVLSLVLLVYFFGDWWRWFYVFPSLLVLSRFFFSRFFPVSVMFFRRRRLGIDGFKLLSDQELLGLLVEKGVGRGGLE